MGLVQYALKFRITVYVLAVLMMLGGAAAVVVMPKDVLPVVDIPVVVVVWTYNGLSAPEMEQRITTYSEYGISNNVNNIARMESTSLQGTSVMKIYFDPSVSIDLAIAQVVSNTNSIRATMPPGVQPPVILRFSASSVPVIQLSLASAKDSLTSVYDYAQYRIRQRLTQVPGSTLPSPFGGAPRQIMVDLDLQALQALGLTPLDVTAAMTAQNLTVPSGLAKIGEQQYPIRLNATPEAIAALNEIPIKVVDRQPVLIRDVANVRDGGPPQVNIVRTDGLPSVLMRILKNGTASTLDVVNNVKKALPDITAAAPAGMTLKTLFDQSVFVSAAIEGVVHEAVIAACLTGLTILLFLGSWRSTIIVLISIPLSILTSLSLLAALGQTINVMTLGGLALAVGILVDDATVAIENTYRLFEEGEPFRESVVEGAASIAKPTLISTLSICAAFTSVFALTDTPKYLFTPQALAVVFAMLTSYLLSRTLVPVLIDVLVAREYAEHHGETGASSRGEGRVGRALGFVTGPAFRLAGRFRHGLRGAVRTIPPGLSRAAARRGGWPAFGRWPSSGLVFVGTAILFGFVGQDYFPQVASGQITMHLRTRPGMRIESDGSGLRRGREDRARGHPRGRDRPGPRQYRPALEQLQLRLLGRLVRRLQRWADADQPEGRATGTSPPTPSACARFCASASPTWSSTSSPPTSSRRSSISARWRRSISRSRAATPPRIWRWPSASSAACARSAAPLTCTCTRSSTRRSSSWTWTGASPPNSG